VLLNEKLLSKNGKNKTQHHQFKHEINSSQQQSRVIFCWVVSMMTLVLLLQLEHQYDDGGQEHAKERHGRTLHCSGRLVESLLGIVVGEAVS